MPSFLLYVSLSLAQIFFFYFFFKVSTTELRIKSETLILGPKVLFHLSLPQRVLYSVCGIGIQVLLFLPVNSVALETVLNLSVPQFTHHCKEKIMLFIWLGFFF